MNFEQITKEVEFVAVRSRGPGGQNVNKVSSAAQLSWNFQNSTGLTAEEKFLISNKLPNYINKSGEIYLRSDEFRDLEKNKSRSLEKLQQILNLALHKPKKRKPTRPTFASKTRKLESKSRRSDVKKSRQRIR